MSKQRKSSINFEKAHGGSLKHNDRTLKPKYLITSPAANEYSCSAAKAEAKLKELFAKAQVNYKKHFGQKLQASTIHWEAVANLNDTHTLEDVQRLAVAIEKETGFTCIQLSIHKDEGVFHKQGKTYRPDVDIFFDEEKKEWSTIDGKVFDTENATLDLNHHAHLDFFSLDRQTGQQLYRKQITKKQQEQQPDLKPMNRARLSKLQDITAEVLKMERGEKGSAAVRLSAKQFKEQKKREDQLSELAKIKDVKAEIKDFKEGLKGEGYTKEDFDRINELNKQLQADAKAKELTIDDLQNRIEELKNNLQQVKEEKANKESELKNEKLALQEQISEAGKVLERAGVNEPVKGWKALWKTLLDAISGFKEQIKDLTKENELLKRKNGDLKRELEELKQSGDGEEEESLSDQLEKLYGKSGKRNR